MLLFTGLPGFFLFALYSLPWSLLAIVAWSLIVWLGLQKIDLGPLADGSFVLRSGGVAALLLVGVAVPLVTRSWPDPATTFAWFGIPVLLAGFAVAAYREHARRGRRFIAMAVPAAALQIQLMIHGALLWIGHIFSGGSPI